MEENPVAEIMEIGEHDDRESPELRARAQETIENGGILHLPRGGFVLTDLERKLVGDASVTLPTRKERESRNGRPTVIFDPDRGRIERTRIRQPQRDELERLMARYAEWAGALVAGLLPAYTGALVRDRVTFRPCERADPQGLHVDSSYGRPTEGRSMLRVFCNMDPAERPRRWQVGERFEPFARRFVPTAKHRRASLGARILAGIGATKGRRTDYDELIADIRGQAKSDARYQADAPRRIVEFPPGSAWIAITDLVLHGALSGQNSLDQTFFLPPTAMRVSERSSLRILERLTERQLL